MSVEKTWNYLRTGILCRKELKFYCAYSDPSTHPPGSMEAQHQYLFSKQFSQFCYSRCLGNLHMVQANPHRKPILDLTADIKWIFGSNNYVTSWIITKSCWMIHNGRTVRGSTLKLLALFTLAVCSVPFTGFFFFFWPLRWHRDTPVQPASH